MKRSIFIFIFVLSLPYLMVTDIAPETYAGISLTPGEHPSIKLRRETVDIYYGEKCRVLARFFMNNPTSKMIKIKIGFPVQPNFHRSPQLYKKYMQKKLRVLERAKRDDLIKKMVKQKKQINEQRKKRLQDIYNFKVRVNGHKIKQISVKTRGDDFFISFPYDCTWFGWENKFPPGEILVEVEYSIIPNFSYRSFCQNINYIISSGAAWKDKIEEARLTIHFPEGISREQIMPGTQPFGFKISGRELSWRFENFEPSMKDNIRCEFLPQAFFKRMVELREKTRIDPSNVKAKLDLARFYFFTLLQKEVGGYLPMNPGVDEFEKGILDRINDENDRKLILSVYIKNLQKMCYKKTEVGPEIKRKLRQILSDIGYEPEYRNATFADEAESLIKEAITINSCSAEAWNTYLAYYGHLHFAGVSCHFFYPLREIQQRQKEIICQAYRNCPHDEGVLLWNKYINNNLKTIPQEIGDLNYLGGKTKIQVSRPDKQGSHTVEITEIEKNIILKYYKKQAKEFMIYSRNSKLGYSGRLINLKKLQKRFLGHLGVLFLEMFYDNTHFVYVLTLKRQGLSAAEKAELMPILHRLGYYSIFYGQKLWDYYERKGIVSRNNLYQF